MVASTYAGVSKLTLSPGTNLVLVKLDILVVPLGSTVNVPFSTSFIEYFDRVGGGRWSICKTNKSAPVISNIEFTRYHKRQ